MRALVFLLASFVSGRTLAKLRTKGPAVEHCGKGFDSLNPGTKDYFNTISDALWTHPGNQDGAGTFLSERQCLFARMIGDSCGGLPVNADRKKDLFEVCNDPKQDALVLLNNFMSDDEFVHWKSIFPTEPVNYALNTLKDMNTKETICSFLFTIDDGCVAFKYVKKA